MKLSIEHRIRAKALERRLKTRHRGNWDSEIPLSTLALMGLQYNYVDTGMLRANGSMVNILCYRSTEEESDKLKRRIGQVQKTLHS